MELRRSARWRALPAAAIAAAALLCASCSPPEPPRLQQIAARGSIKVATLNLPTTYYHGAHGPQGTEYQLSTAFAMSLGVGLEIYSVANLAALREEIRSGRADIVAASITPDSAWNQFGRNTDSYQDIAQVVVGRRGQARVRSLDALAGRKIAIRADSPQLQVLDDLRAGGAPELQWQIVPRGQTDPLDRVAEGIADYAVIDASEFAYAQHLYPAVAIAFTLPAARSARWIVARRSTDLAARINAFFSEMRSDDRLETLLREAAPDSPRFQLQTSQALQRDIENELPALRPFFEAAALATGVDWRLLAALGYVESKWQTQASSGDGARGVMMLTGDTATEMGVTDRTDPEQNILAGARYFVQVRDKLPERIAEPDRTWFTLAAYNVGYGHLEDARILAQSRGKDPDSWTDVHAALPLLAQEQWYANAKHGYARGWEPAQMVDRVQLFLKLLEWQGESLSVDRVMVQPKTAEPDDGA